MAQIKRIMLLTVFGFISSSFTGAHRSCGTPNPSKTYLALSKQAELLAYGKTVNDIKQSDVSPILQSIQTNSNGSPSAFRLTDIPIVFHILSGQNFGSVLQPSMTLKQARWTTTITNKLFRIYDKKSKKSVQFASFKFNRMKDFIVHSDLIINKDCGWLEEDEYRTIVRKASEWEFKIHVLVCESSEFFGATWGFPSDFEVTDPLHNMILVDHRGLACYDDTGNFLCELSTNGTMTSKTGWSQARSAVVAHEFGHLFGLLHTFEGGCSKAGDGVFDTPTTDYDGRKCSGLLPYNKNRNLFYGTRMVNFANESSQCGGDNKLCGHTCAACCDKKYGPDCTDIPPGLPFEVITEDEIDNPVCCTPDESKPLDSCRLFTGIDPQNNIMSYSADYCRHELTVGQMMRMMVQIRAFKSYMYCNYASVEDDAICASIPCSTTATSPNCV